MPDEHYEARTKLTANIEADTAAVLRWAASGDTAGIQGGTRLARGGPRLAVVRAHDAPAADPVYRLIVAVDLEQSSRRTNAVQSEARRIMYDLLGRALQAAGIGPKHLEPMEDRGDGLLILIRPHDDVPKTLVLGRLPPALNALLIEHNAAVGRPELQLRLHMVVHSGEIHDDGRGYFGQDLEIAFRLLDSPATKRALKQASPAPLVVVVSDEIYEGVARHGYLDATYQPLVSVRMGRGRRRGWVNIPNPSSPPPAVAPA